MQIPDGQVSFDNDPFERIADGGSISFSNRLNTKYALKAGILRRKSSTASDKSV
ncbi:MAG: hypothetical protein ACJA13_001288 [Paraglaciecola sp.]|jgi:hypothetical protein